MKPKVADNTQLRAGDAMLVKNMEEFLNLVTRINQELYVLCL
jgi:hypothetical protein